MFDSSSHADSVMPGGHTLVDGNNLSQQELERAIDVCPYLGSIAMRESREAALEHAQEALQAKQEHVAPTAEEIDDTFDFMKMVLSKPKPETVKLDSSITKTTEEATTEVFKNSDSSDSAHITEQIEQLTQASEPAISTVAAPLNIKQPSIPRVIAAETLQVQEKTSALTTQVIENEPLEVILEPLKNNTLTQIDALQSPVIRQELFTDSRQVIDAVEAVSTTAPLAAVEKTAPEPTFEANLLEVERIEEINNQNPKNTQTTLGTEVESVDPQSLTTIQSETSPTHEATYREQLVDVQQEFRLSTVFEDENYKTDEISAEEISTTYELLVNTPIEPAQTSELPIDLDEALDSFTPQAESIEIPPEALADVRPEAATTEPTVVDPNLITELREQPYEPLEKTLPQLARIIQTPQAELHAYVPENPTSSQDVQIDALEVEIEARAELQEALSELHIAIQASTVKQEIGDEELPTITPEITEKMIAVLRAIGYEEPAKVLIAFAEQYGTRNLVKVFHQLSMMVYDADHKEILSANALASLSTIVDDSRHRIGSALLWLVGRLHPTADASFNPAKA